MKHKENKIKWKGTGMYYQKSYKTSILDDIEYDNILRYFLSECG